MARSTLEKLVAARALVAKYEAELANAKAILNLSKGDTVEYTYGRADRKRTLTGVITAIKTDEKGVSRYKVEDPTDFDSKPVILFARDITANLSNPTVTTELAIIAAPTNNGEGVVQYAGDAVNVAELQPSIEAQQSYDGIYPTADALAQVQ